MPLLYLLGTGAGFSAPHRTTTMLAITDGASTLLVDCGGDVIQRYLEAGLGLDTLDGLIITHEHPDHVAGFPLFMEKIWLAGRRAPIPIYGIPPALEQARRCWNAFDTQGWDDLPEMLWTAFPHKEHADVLDAPPWRVTASPGIHGKPVVGLRFEHREGGVLAYSCDTEPAPSIARLARNADLLIHEATGSYDGHASAQQAAEVAAEANVSRLVLVHLPPSLDPADLNDARAIFPTTEWGTERGAYPFPHQGTG